MSEIAIRAENLSKQYILGQQQKTYKTLRESIAQTASAVGQGLMQSLGKKPPHASAREEFWALKDVSFEIKRGDRVGIVGRNGAGKSTLLKVLSRITEPTRGSIKIKGRVASLLEVGTGFHPELNGRENIYLNGAILGMSRAEIKRKFDEIVTFAEVTKFLDTPVKHYSSGMYVRLAFAVAAHLEPEILVVDEVLAVGDAEFQKKCLGKMQDVATNEGRTVLFVSHNMGAVSALCNQGIYLAGGRVKALGEAEAIVTHYLTELFSNEVEDIAQLRFAGTGKEIRFQDIVLLSEDGSSLVFGQPIGYELSIKSEIDLNDLNIGSSLFTITGNCIGTLFTKEKFSIKANQEIKLNLIVRDLKLAPGSYYAGFSIGRGNQNTNRSDLDIVIGKPAFQVLPMSSKGDSIATWHSGWGSVVLQDVQLTILI